MQWGDYTTLPSHGPPFHRGALYQKATTVPPEARYVGLAFSQSPAEARGFITGGHGIALSDAMVISNAAARTDGPVLEFNSPTGQYQRGPPMSISIFG